MYQFQSYFCRLHIINERKHLFFDKGQKSIHKIRTFLIYQKIILYISDRELLVNIYKKRILHVFTKINAYLTVHTAYSVYIPKAIILCFRYYFNFLIGLWNRYNVFKILQNGSRYICPNDCGRTYSTEASVRFHFRYECGREKKYKCSACGKLFLRKANLKSHSVNVHKILDLLN